jgi:hypothetical protein
VGYRFRSQERLLHAVRVDDSGAPGAPGTVMQSSEILPFLDDSNSNRREVSSVWCHGVADGTQIQTTRGQRVCGAHRRNAYRRFRDYELRPRSTGKETRFQQAACHHRLQLG